MYHNKHFTIDEAKETLDKFKPLISEMIELKQNLDASGYDIYNHQYFGGSGPNGTGEFPQSAAEKLLM